MGNPVRERADDDDTQRHHPGQPGRQADADGGIQAGMPAEGEQARRAGHRSLRNQRHAVRVTYGQVNGTSGASRGDGRPVGPGRVRPLEGTAHSIPEKAREAARCDAPPTYGRTDTAGKGLPILGSDSGRDGQVHQG